jgi:hypothetical protein
MADFATLCRFGSALLLASAALATVGCDSSVGGERGGTGGDDGTGSGSGGNPPVTPESIDALDLLLVIDGSGSMADKQGFLSQAIGPFLDRIRNPRCVDATYAPIADQPALNAPCPEGSVRQYAPDVTVHVGVITSSLGTPLGGDGGVCDTAASPNNNDHGHLVWRSTPGTATNDIPTYENLGFFAYDPGAQLSPTGESDFAAFSDNVESAIRGVGEVGCGFEAPLEAMYRFLADPEPGLIADDENSEVDETVLDQRAAFLRDDAVLQVLLLSDEDDASFRNDRFGGFGSSPEQSASMPRARAECAADPNDPCCASCIDAVPSGCSGDGACAEPGNANNPANFFSAEDAENGVNIRSWDTKRRFGIDFLYPVERYVEALQSPTLTVFRDTSAPNPLFEGVARRVFFTAVVGVPWQDVARDASDPTQGFQSNAEMLTRGTWDVIVGDPAANVQPSDPLMIQHPDPRPGLSTSPGSNPVNGNEWATEYEDLQYACVFDLPVEAHRECDGEQTGGCDCSDSQAPGKPVCDPNEPLLQIRAKAYPGARQLQVAKGLGDAANVVPLCGLFLTSGEPAPGPVGTFILEKGLEDTADQVAALMSGATE